MSKIAQRPYVMSIAGFDPTAGAGILADIKCFEQNETYGFGICSALTVQTDSEFLKNSWLSVTEIIDQMAPLLYRFKVAAVKIGLIKDIAVLLEVIAYLKKHQTTIKIVLDPVLKASAGYAFHDWDAGLKHLLPVLKQINLITPNYPEMLSMGGQEEVFTAAGSWSAYCPVLLKGGHMKTHIGTDYLFENKKMVELKPSVTKVYQKHGSGCVLSAAITATLAKNHTLLDACKHAKKYTEQFLNSNESLLGHHKLQFTQ
ncbi:hydroxymethylpyrimidine/phosphomethylpyrimidine kinase [Pedobacter nyackensis]|uniref:hydroxymethylpyrimidine/phosphomethylpyrimidine kinase n=1 Tax=Pedobacter nyackensis TaxID=475255 RepID=UPI00292E6F25|nr:hydroxymethylpyrimidine/phosphomethylpyrimidine kinase [Pedobacter nyackensis]